MKKYTVILENGYYMELEADSIKGASGNVLQFYKGKTLVAAVASPVAWVDGSGIDGYWFKHL